MYEDLKELARNLKSAKKDELANRIVKAVFSKLLEECTTNLNLTQGQSAEREILEQEFMKVFFGEK